MIFNIAIDSLKPVLNRKENNVFTSDTIISIVVKYYRGAIISIVVKYYQDVISAVVKYRRDAICLLRLQIQPRLTQHYPLPNKRNILLINTSNTLNLILMVHR